MHGFSELVEPMDIPRVRLYGALNAGTYRARSFPMANSWIWLEINSGDAMSPSPLTALIKRLAYGEPRERQQDGPLHSVRSHD